MLLWKGIVSTKSDAAAKFQDQRPTQPIVDWFPENFFFSDHRNAAMADSGFSLQSSQGFALLDKSLK